MHCLTMGTHTEKYVQSTQWAMICAQSWEWDGGEHEVQL